MPRGALADLGVGAGRDQPALHDFLQETVLHEAFAVNPAQVVGTKHTPVALLERLELVEGFSQLFVWRGHEPPIFVGHYKSIVVREYKYIALSNYKSIALRKYKSIASRRYKYIVIMCTKATFI